jgi:hypothetical protein
MTDTVKLAHKLDGVQPVPCAWMNAHGWVISAAGKKAVEALEQAYPEAERYDIPLGRIT